MHKSLGVARYYMPMTQNTDGISLGLINKSSSMISNASLLSFSVRLEKCILWLYIMPHNKALLSIYSNKHTTKTKFTDIGLFERKGKLDLPSFRSSLCIKMFQSNGCHDHCARVRMGREVTSVRFLYFLSQKTKPKQRRYMNKKTV